MRSISIVGSLIFALSGAASAQSTSVTTAPGLLRTCLLFERVGSGYHVVEMEGYLGVDRDPSPFVVLGESECERADINDDGAVGVYDYSILFQHFGWERGEKCE